MPPKKQIAPPIDRPLSRAYLRGFMGWSTAYAPAMSDPTTLRIMENVMVDRNGALSVRPGLRYLSYADTPDMDPVEPGVQGAAYPLSPIGSQEPFYTADGEKALLFAVREESGKVGFRALAFSDSRAVVHDLTDDMFGFTIPGGAASLEFSAGTTHVEYLQIDNKILALSDNGDPMRYFNVGEDKSARALNEISVPAWENDDKLKVVQPDVSWITDSPTTTRYNNIINPSFEAGASYWKLSANAIGTQKMSAPNGATPRSLQVVSRPSRTNMVNSPLHDVPGKGIAGWAASTDYGTPTLTKDGNFLKIASKASKGLFMAFSSKTATNVAGEQRYRASVDLEKGGNVVPCAMFAFYNTAGALIGTRLRANLTASGGRFVTAAVKSPKGAVTARLYLGGENTGTTATYVRVRNALMCRDGEALTMFHGETPDTSTASYYWAGAVNASASLQHADQTVTVTSTRGPVAVKKSLLGYAYVKMTGGSVKASLMLRGFDKNGTLVFYRSSSAIHSTTWAPIRAHISEADIPASCARASIEIICTGLGYGDSILIDAAMLESRAGDTVTPYFDGSSAPTATTSSSWLDPRKPHLCSSRQVVRNNLASIPPKAATATSKTLIATGGADANKYKIGLFYTFSNEIGESAPSKITEVRVSRPWSNWYWETPNGASEPSGVTTEVDTDCADQLVVYMPRDVFDAAIAQGARSWTLYGFAWSDQEPVPVVARIINTRKLYPDVDGAVLQKASIMNTSYAEAGWLPITPSRRATFEDMGLPSANNRVNYSQPPGARMGLVAGDRAIVLGDEDNLATIRWSSNRFGQNLDFSAQRGGGTKTLTTGNITVPACVVLWQNPQSVDTLTVLCIGSDGQSSSYYMSPATVNSGQAGSVPVMGFEETTNSPGTVSPYAAEVLNNALYRPLEDSLLKSTAANYNINHKTQTDLIANMWRSLRSKSVMKSAQLDNRLYYLVHNPFGELLESGCTGNEIWVYDIGTEGGGKWSRFLVQGSMIRPVSLGRTTYMGVTRPDGLYYLDPSAREDDYVAEDRRIKQRPIPWRIETNTQGANRAHDAWAHLRQVGVVLGNFVGTMCYGVHGHDRHGMEVRIDKTFHDIPDSVADTGQPWDVEDWVMVGRDLKEWFFFAESVPGKPSSGNLALVQYRYTPVSVNVGGEFGSVETFEYGSNPAGYAENGIPLPYIDHSQP